MTCALTFTKKLVCSPEQPCLLCSRCVSTVLWLTGPMAPTSGGPVWQQDDEAVPLTRHTATWMPRRRGNLEQFDYKTLPLRTSHWFPGTPKPLGSRHFVDEVLYFATAGRHKVFASAGGDMELWNAWTWNAWSIRTKTVLVHSGCQEAVDPGYRRARMSNDER